MKIGIDCRMYGPKQAGLGRYIEQLVLGLREIDRENEYVLFFTKDNHECFATNCAKVKKVIANVPWYSWKEQVKLPKIIKKEKIDLMHFPHWNVPLFYQGPFVLTIHDLIMYHYPRPEATTLGPLKYWFKDRVHRLVVRHAVKKAKHIIVTSEFTKQDAHQTLGVPLEKMTVIYQAPFVKNPKSEIRNPKQLEKFKITKSYVLYIGNAYPHKNLEGLLKAWEIFQEKYHCHSEPRTGINSIRGKLREESLFQLVLAGKKSYFYDRLRTLDFGLQNSVIYTNYISDNELPIFYQNASLFVFPSLYEGFGLPPLEAMSYGVPVASSNASCLPEVLGEAALYFDPENYEQMADAIYKGLNDENIRFELQQKAKEELKRYSGKAFAERALRIYDKMQGGFLFIEGKGKNVL